MFRMFHHAVRNAGDTVKYIVKRMDDHGNVFDMQGNLSQQEARQMANRFQAKGHKQTYWEEPETTPTNPTNKKF